MGNGNDQLGLINWSTALLQFLKQCSMVIVLYARSKNYFKKQTEAIRLLKFGLADIPAVRSRAGFARAWRVNLTYLQG